MLFVNVVNRMGTVAVVFDNGVAKLVMLPS